MENREILSIEFQHFIHPAPAMKSTFFRAQQRAFSLTEILVVMGIIAMLATLSLPALNSLSRAGTVNKAIVDLSGTIEVARQYAMANNTYTRVIIAQLPATGARSTPATVAMALYCADGTGGGSIDSTTDWPALRPPLILDNLLVFDSLYTAPSDVNGSKAPSQLGFPTASRKVAGAALSFTSAIQFGPSGQMADNGSQPVRYVVIACDRPGKPSDTTTPQRRNPFALRIFGQNGLISVLRAENL